MKKILMSLFFIIFILNLLKQEMVFYIPFNIPGSQMAATIPPFGIFIENKYQNETKGKGSILSHEKIHWMQYRKYGLLGFYTKYIYGYLKYGRKYSPMEEEARKLSKL